MKVLNIHGANLESDFLYWWNIHLNFWLVEDWISDNINNILELSIEWYLKIIFEELFSAQKPILSNNNSNFWFFERKYPGIWNLVENRLKNWIQYKKTKWINIEYLIKEQLTKSPESFIVWLINDLELDFYDPTNMGLESDVNKSKDIPDQVKEAEAAGVLGKYNWTIWVLRDESGNIVANPEIINILNENTLSDINNILNYHPWIWLDSFRKTMSLLIKHEEWIYNWPEIKGEVTEPYFVPGWVGGLTLFKDSFLNEWDLVILPNYRWPNIDGVIMNKTRVPPAQIDLINPDWSLNLNTIWTAIQNWINNWRKRISIYLNFPNNPTWVRMSESDKIELNNILSQFKNDNVNIQIISDDPYWAFSVLNNDKEKLDSPLSYHIDTSKNVTLFELWSHWTKEAGIYWLRVWILRVFGNKDNISNLDKKIKLSIRETFSMSPISQQEVMIKAILWSDIDVFNIEQINWLSEEEISFRIDRYIRWRNKMLKIIYPKLNNFKKAILDLSGDYLQVMDNVLQWESQTWWFMLCFTLTQKSIDLGITFKSLQNICINNWNNKCAFTIFDDDVNNTKSMRITLIGWNVAEYARRLQDWINKIIK